MSSKEGQTVIEFRDVVRTYGEGEALQYAVNHINFTIDKGEFVVILGICLAAWISLRKAK